MSDARICAGCRKVIAYGGSTTAAGPLLFHHDCFKVESVQGADVREAMEQVRTALPSALQQLAAKQERPALKLIQGGKK